MTGCPHLRNRGRLHRSQHHDSTSPPAFHRQLTIIVWSTVDEAAGAEADAGC